VRVIARFKDYPGRFPYHCHILDHEDHEMMRQFQAVYPAPPICNDPEDPLCCGNNTCDPGEDCVSCPNDCAQVSGASCGNGLCEVGDGENCANCPDDCGGRQKGNQNSQFCCGVDDGQVNNPVGCDRGGIENRCIDSAAGLACRDEDRPRVSACCGDALCEGQEEVQGADFCQVDCDPGPPPVCTRNAPTFAMGNDQSIAVDGSAVYTLDVTNNDTAACPDTTFDLSVNDTNGTDFVIPSTLGQNSVLLAPGANTDVTLTVTGQLGAPNGAANDTTVATAGDANHGIATSNTVTTTINVAGGVCGGITKRKDCNNTPGCTWDQGARACVDAP
jgi:hypothetical protein